MYPHPKNPEEFSREFQLLCGYITYDTTEESIMLNPYYPDTDISKQGIEHIRPNRVHELVRSRTSLSMIPEYPADERQRIKETKKTLKRVRKDAIFKWILQEILKFKI